MIQKKIVIIFIFVACFLVNSTYNGKWRRGVPITTILPVGYHQGIQLVSEDVSLFLDNVFVTVQAKYCLKNTSDKNVRLKAGMWRYGTDYLNGIKVILNKLIFNSCFDSQIKQDLKNLIIPQKLKHLFYNKKTPICQNGIQFIQKSDSSWQIINNDKIFILNIEQNDLNVYLHQPCDSLEMIKANNQSTFQGPDYLFTLDFNSNEQIIVEVYCRALMNTNKDREISFMYEARYGKQWFNPVNKVTIRTYSPKEEKWKFISAFPPGYKIIDNVLIWENNSQIRNSYCKALYK